MSTDDTDQPGRVFCVSDPELQRLVQHVINTWPHRQTIAATTSVHSEMLAECPDMRQFVETEAHLKIEEMTRGQMVIRRRLSWRTNPDLDLFVRYQHDSVVQVEALVLPPVPESPGHFRPRASGFTVPHESIERFAALIEQVSESADSSSPDTSQPYPLDALLADISDLTA